MAIAASTAAAFHILHVSYPTQKSWLPDPRFPVYVEKIARCVHHAPLFSLGSRPWLGQWMILMELWNGRHRAKHGSDTESYTMDGTFDKARFEGIFDKYDVVRVNAF